MSEDEDMEPEPAQQAAPAPKRKRSKPKKKSPPKQVLARLTQYEIEERRGHIEKLRTQGLHIRQIAKLLGVSVYTVERDLTAIQGVNTHRITDFEKQQHLGASLSRFAQLRQEAWARYYGAKEDRHKLKALELLMSLEKEETGMLVDTGVIVKPKEAPQEVKVAHTLALDWSPDMQAKVAQALLQQSLRSNLAEPTPEALMPIMDAEVVTATGTANAEVEDPEDT